MELIYTIGIIISAIAGLFISGYIAKNKNKGNQMLCPLGHNCDEVINGRFSKFLGLRVEFVGIIYYLAIAGFYLSILFINVPREIIFYVLALTGISFAFTVYLLIAQLIVIKKWCTTCLGSSAFSFLIVVMSFLGFEASFGDYLFGHHDVLNWIFVGSIIVGVLTTTLYARTFIKFLKDFKISEKESKRLTMLSQTGWVAIVMTFLAGLGLTLTDIYGNFTENSAYIVMIIILGIVFVYEIIVNMFVGPKLMDIHFGENSEFDDAQHMRLRKTAFAFLAVGVVSWYVLLLLNTLSFYKYSSGFLLIGYVVMLLIAVVVALFAENIFYRKSILVTVEEEKETSLE